MKSRLFVLLTALFMVGNVFAGTPLEDDLGNFRRKCPVC